MPSATPADVRALVAKRTPAPVYLIVGDDDAEISHLAADITGIVEDELRAFNVDRLYAGEKAVTPAAIVESARMLPMMSDRRVVVVLRGERLLKPKRRGRAAEAESSDDEDGEPATDLDVLTEYVQRPEPTTTLVITAADVDKSRRIGKALYKSATVVECWGLKPGKGERVDLRQAARMAEQLVKKAVADAGQQIEPQAARLVAERAGADIVRLRGDLDRLLLYAAGKPKITLADAREVVSAEASQDDWAVTNAIQQGNTAEALRQIGLALDGGGVPFQILGQLAWFVREKLAMSDPRRVPAAVDALFRTDLDLKSSGGDPRVLLERLVVELCKPGLQTRRNVTV
jgi:DNA polymerase-3 subunit delta